MLIDLDHAAVGHERERPGIELRQIGSENERRPHHRPQRQHASLLIMCQPGCAVFALAGVRPKMPERHHIGIGKVAGLRIRCPRRSQRELIAQPMRILLVRHPVIPDIVEMRHISANCPTSAAWLSPVGPGDKLNTIGRPVFSIARRIMRISVALYGRSEMQSTLRKSTPQPAYCLSSESYQ